MKVENLNKSSCESVLIFFVNGKKVTENDADPEQTLLTYLRSKLRLCGTKLGCGEGGCGACTVMISKFDRKSGCVKHFSANACLMPICAVHGLAVTTIEGIGNTRTKLHPVQERLAKSHGSQCGFCTPGIVMSMYSLLRSLPKPKMSDIETAFQGNLCRCTGYRPILEGYRTFTECSMGENCCKNLTNNNQNGITNGNCQSKELSLFNQNEFAPYDPSQEPIFPPALKISDNFDRESLIFRNERTTWYRPTTLVELLKLKEKYPDAKLITGNTEVGVEVKFKYFDYPHLISTSGISELNEITELENGIEFGASVTLNDFEQMLQDQIKKISSTKSQIFRSIVKMLQYFAGKQIRNVASIGGNIATASPISDLNPIFLAADIELKVANSKCRKIIKMNEEFFVGYRKTKVQPDDVIVTVFIPHSKADEYFVAYKQAKRREDDIAIVNTALYVRLKPKSDVVEDMRIAYGGMAPTTILAFKSKKAIIGMRWGNDMIEKLSKHLIEELPLSHEAPGGMILYRRSLTLSLLFKAYLKITQHLENKIETISKIPDKEKSGASSFHNTPIKSTQLFETPNNYESSHDKVGQNQVHLSAFKQATGEAIYCDDMPKYENELYLAFVLSSKAHAKIISIDPSEALKQSGVHQFFASTDLSDDQNHFGPVVHDEEIFQSKVVTSNGQIIGAIVGDTQAIAQRAARMVKVQYEELSPTIITIKDAIKYKSYHQEEPIVLTRGNVERSFEESDFLFENEFHMGGQEHFYLETNTAIAVPKDPDELEVISSSQHQSELQTLIAHALGIQIAKVVVKVKRMGGAFGGKESRSYIVALPVAVAAFNLKRPVRCMLDRDEDMVMLGTRHPFLFKYKVGCSKEGKIMGCEIQIYSNAGYSMDLSMAVLERAVFQIENSYYIPNIRVIGWCCKTNITSCTAFRGFGGPQGMMLAEHIIRTISSITKRSYVDVAELNLYRSGQTTHYNQIIEGNNLLRCWNEVITNSKFHQRQLEVSKFNKENRWKKRGLSIVPTQFGIAYTLRILNQAGALVHVYLDGSVLISHGGTEMGQGLHTKMIQVASRCLNLPIDKIHISESSTDKVPNTSPTAASASSDLNGMAIIKACEKILKRLEPIKEKHPDKEWNFWITQAYCDRISLSATGFYATPELAYDIKTNKGKLFNYFTIGAGCSEVEIDCLTGDHKVIRTDIVMDVGSSLNPAIDIGQIEGGFVQGYGLFTIEEMVYSSKGVLFSRGPGMYKIPGFGDIPIEFNVSLLKDAPNPKAVYSSKAIGEPPLFLAASVFFAIKEAIIAARLDAGFSEDFKFNSPATAARIRMACVDQFTSCFEEPEEGSFTPWNVVP